MLWTALGLLIATVVSIEEAVTGEKPRTVKVLVTLLAVAGLVVGTASTVSENNDKKSAEQTAEGLKSRLDTQKLACYYFTIFGCLNLRVKCQRHAIGRFLSLAICLAPSRPRQPDRVPPREQGNCTQSDCCRPAEIA